MLIILHISVLWVGSAFYKNVISLYLQEMCTNIKRRVFGVCLNGTRFVMELSI